MFFFGHFSKNCQVLTVAASDTIFMTLLWGGMKHEVIMEKVRSKLSSEVANFVAQFEAFLGLTCFISFSNLSTGPVDAFASLRERTAVLQIWLVPHLWRLREDVAINI